MLASTSTTLIPGLSVVDGNANMLVLPWRDEEMTDGRTWWPA